MIREMDIQTSIQHLVFDLIMAPTYHLVPPPTQQHNLLMFTNTHEDSLLVSQ